MEGTHMIREKEEKSMPSEAVIKRLPRYYRYLRELLSENVLRISSGELASLMGVTASQIRQDLNCFGDFGQQGYGYSVKRLFGEISSILGADKAYNAVIVGAGNLGKALASSSVFGNRGVILKALFDVDEAVIGAEINRLPVYDMKDIDRYFAENRVDIAVLTVPKSEATGTAERLRGLGVGGIWNFTGVELGTINGIPALNMHMGDMLMTLCYKIKAESEKKTQNTDEGRAL